MKMTILTSPPPGLYPPFRDDGIPRMLNGAYDVLEDCRSCILAGNWVRLHARIPELTGYADLLLRHVSVLTALNEMSATYLRERDRQFADFLAQAKGNSAAARTARDNFLAELKKSQGSKPAAQAALQAMLGGRHPVTRSRALSSRTTTAEQESLVRAHVTVSIAACRAAVDASVLEASDRVRPESGIPTGDAARRIAVSQATTLNDVHDQTARELYQALRGSGGLRGYTDTLGAGYSRLLYRIPAAATILGIYLGILANQPQGVVVTQASERAALELGAIIRRSLMLFGYLCIGRAEAETIGAQRWYLRERRRASGRQLASAIPAGRRIDAAQLIAGRVRDGALVQVDGRIDNLVIKTDPRPPKFSSFCDLLDSRSGTSVKLRAHMFSLRNNGVRNGTFVRVNGYARIGARWNAGKNGLDIDRVNLTDSRRQSWYDDVTAQVRKYYKLFPDEMNMDFTPTPLD